MSIRWPKYLPRWPAVLLLPAVLAAWALQCSIPWVCGSSYGIGFPLPFRRHDGHWGWSPLKLDNVLIDLTLALVTAYTLAMVVDRLVFPLIRGRRRQERTAPSEPT